MNRADVSWALPKLGPERAEAVLKKLRELGVIDRDDVQYLKEADLTKDGFLKQVEARRLISKISKSANDHSGLYFESIYTILKL